MEVIMKKLLLTIMMASVSCQMFAPPRPAPKAPQKSAAKAAGGGAASSTSTATKPKAPASSTAIDLGKLTAEAEKMDATQAMAQAKTLLQQATAAHKVATSTTLDEEALVTFKDHAKDTARAAAEVATIAHKKARTVHNDTLVAQMAANIKKDAAESEKNQAQQSYDGADDEQKTNLKAKLDQAETKLETATNAQTTANANEASARASLEQMVQIVKEATTLLNKYYTLSLTDYNLSALALAASLNAPAKKITVPLALTVFAVQYAYNNDFQLPALPRLSDIFNVETVKKHFKRNWHTYVTYATIIAMTALNNRSAITSCFVTPTAPAAGVPAAGGGALAAPTSTSGLQEAGQFLMSLMRSANTGMQKFNPSGSYE